jgi:hypothetical protein
MGGQIAERERAMLDDRTRALARLLAERASAGANTVSQNEYEIAAALLTADDRGYARGYGEGLEHAAQIAEADPLADATWDVARIARAIRQRARAAGARPTDASFRPRPKVPKQTGVEGRCPFPVPVASQILVILVSDVVAKVPGIRTILLN